MYQQIYPVKTNSFFYVFIAETDHIHSTKHNGVSQNNEIHYRKIEIANTTEAHF